MKPYMRFPKIHVRKILVPLLVVMVIGGIGFIVKKSRSNSKSGDSRIEIMNAKATQSIQKEFAFPLKDAKGEVLTTIKYTIESAELRDEIVVKGQRASAVKGRTFLIIPIKITNEYKQSIDMQSKDYIRLTVNGNVGELLAPDIHNDPVTVQALSTKSTRVGFPINDTDTKLTLVVGELNGDKQAIELTLK